MDNDRTAGSPFLTDWAILTYLALAKLLIHLSLNGRYGYHHDELYFIACGRHLSFGYVDHAPLVPWIARLSLSVFGHSLRGLRFLPALSGALTVFLTGMLVRRMGGRRFAQTVACIAVIIAPVFLRSGNVLAIPSFEPMYWVLASYLVVRIVQEDKPRLWLWVGLVVGVGLMNKHTMVFFGAALVAGLILTPSRKYFKSPWLWAGGALALLIFLPNILWQIANGWPTLEFVQALNAGTMSRIPLVEFLFGQVLYLHPVNAPVWLAGLCFFIFSKAGKPYRILGWIYVTVFVLLLVAKSKIYYLAPAYPALLAGGGLAIERFATRRQWDWLKPVTMAALAVGGMVFAPPALPILDIDTTDRYVRIATLGAIKNAYELTGDLHGQFGWEERVAAVAAVYDGLSAEEKAQCTVFAAWYGLAGAIDYFGDAYGLPNAISGHMTYYLWGPGEGPHETVIAVGIDSDSLARAFDDVQEAAVFSHPHINPWDNNLLIAVCRRPKQSLHTLWPRLRDWD